MIPWSDDDQGEDDLTNTICWKCWWWSWKVLIWQNELMMIWWSWKVLIWQNELAATFPRCLLHLQVVDSPRCIMVKMNSLNYIHHRLESLSTNIWVMFIVRKVKGIWHCRATNLITPARCRVPTVITNMQTRANKFEIWTHPHHGRTALKWQIRFVGSLHESDRWWCWCAFGDGLGQKLAAKSNCIEISTSPTSSPSAAKNIKKSKLLLFSTYTKAHK